ncbi:Bug family tripartite tricarboxylate transporter substrate binding protein [Pseudacidovorax intermedius]|uniref:Bug family tripartite tricarboxylate transporter substrate binding protein n=1 Tax=Pseudacidovorax intermedius TaxID=433924 RepID=UPI000344AD26|nr:tripartite tricarboxylate transporter substrate binding protein [Pseudacidovorax intermedius]
MQTFRPQAQARLARRMLLARAAFGAALALSGSLVAAQNYPAKPISLVVPFPAGGATDTVTRLVAQHLGQVLGQTVVVDNVAGASGAIAAQKVVRAAPDGYTLLAGTVNEVVLAPIVTAGTPYKHQDLAPIGEIGVTPFVLVANPKLPANSIDELLALARQKPGTLNVGVPGLGTLQHVATAMLASQAKVDWLTVPYKGAAPLNADLLGGQVDLAVVTLPSAIGYIQDGKIKSLGLMSLHRDERAKDIATINEGREIKGFTTDAWMGLLAPAKTPAAVIAAMNAALTQTLAKPEVREGLAKLGYRVEPGTPAQFGELMAREDARYRKLAATVKLDR